MKKLLLILVCFPTFGFGQQTFNFMHNGLNREGTQGIYKGKYNPANAGKIDWISTAEFDPLSMYQPA